MPYTINALDNEFAVATGSNVNSGPDRSTFDFPPSSSTNLVITSQEGDTTPNVFSVGDTYDLSWSGNMLQDATVIRSDPVSYNGDNGHAVVFEGTNGSGETVQVVWAPDFDLQTWYSDNYDPDNPPGFYTSDVNPAAEYQYVCFAAGTRIAVPGGDRAVEDLNLGDLVLTLDHGPQPLRWIGQRSVGGRAAMAPVTFAPDTLGNARPLRVSPQHRILTQSWKVEMLFGHDQMLLPARAFVGQPGVTQTPIDRVDYVHLLFDRHEIVLAEEVACESLLLGKMALDVLRPPEDDATAEAGLLFPEVLQMHKRHGMKAARPVLKMREASAFLQHVPPPPLRVQSYLF